MPAAFPLPGGRSESPRRWRRNGSRGWRKGWGYGWSTIAILATMREAEARVTGVRAAPSGPLRVSAPTSFGRLHIAPHLHRFLDDHPAVALEFNLSDGFVDLIGERIDVALRIAPEIAPDLVAHRLGTSRRLLCAAPAYLARHDAPETIAQLSDHRLLAATGQMPWRLVSGTRRATIEQPSAVITNSSEIVRELALTGVGIALRSLWDVGETLARGDLVRILPDWEGSTTRSTRARRRCCRR